MTNLETAAAAYATERQQAYVAKRGGTAPLKAAMDVYDWAFMSFMARNRVAA